MIKVKDRKLLLLPGDGIGPEVVREVKKIIEWFNKNKSLDFKIYRPKLICVEIYDEDIEKSNINIFLKDLEYTRKWSATFSHLYTDNLTDFN